jgi:hypothetical protein
MDRGLTKPLYGNYRAKVVSNKDKEKFGRVLVWIPDLMIGIDDTKGIWARPANNPMGGRNKLEGETDCYYAGTSYIPANGSWLWIFFEAGNVNRPYYFASLDIENAKTLPENQLGSEYSKKWVIFKSHEGRTIVISDDPDDARVEITGKKRKIKEPPSGDTESVYEIDDNQTTILLDERNGKEKLLIRTYKGDFINIDVEEQKLYIQFESDVEIKTNGTFKLTSSDNIEIRSETGDVNITSNTGKMNIKSTDEMKQSSQGAINLKAQNDFIYSAGGRISGLAGGVMSHDGATLNEQGGASSPASEASSASSASPKGDRK